MRSVGSLRPRMLASSQVAEGFAVLLHDCLRGARRLRFRVSSELP